MRREIPYIFYVQRIESERNAMMRDAEIAVSTLQARVQELEAERNAMVENLEALTAQVLLISASPSPSLPVSV